MKKNMLNPYHVEGDMYFLIKKYTTPDDEMKRTYRARLAQSQPATAGAFYYSAHVARTGQNGKNIAAIVYANIDD